MLPTTRPISLAALCLALMVACDRPDSTVKPAPVDSSYSPLPVQNRNPLLDKSPMDMIYYPVDYPVLKMSGKLHSQPIARVIYSRPDKDGRIIFGGVVKYGAPWRLGANEATEIELFRDVSILGQRVKRGRYVLYCVPYENRWTIVFNGDLYTWGLKINQRLDIYRFDVPVTLTNSRYEVFTMKFERLEKEVGLSMAWDNVYTVLPIRGIKKGSE